MSEYGTGSGSGTGEGLVRELAWPCDGPAELEVSIDMGRVQVQLVTVAAAEAGGISFAKPAGADDIVDAVIEDAVIEDDAGGDVTAAEPTEGEVRVQVRYDPSSGGSWAQGIGGLLNWLSESGGSFAGGFGGAVNEAVGGAFGAPGVSEVAARAVRAAEVSWSPAARRLVVRPSDELPLRVVPLAVTVTAPTGSRLAVRAASGDVTVTGVAAWAALRTGAGRISAGAVTGDGDVTTGSGDVDLGPVAGKATVRTGSGDIRIDAIGGPSTVRTSSGSVLLREVGADVNVKTGSGAVTVADARTGQIEVNTGSGDLRFGVHPGAQARLDLSTGTGRARSDFDVVGVAPERPTALVLKGRTGSGDVVVTRGPA